MRYVVIHMFKRSYQLAIYTFELGTYTIRYIFIVKKLINGLLNIIFFEILVLIILIDIKIICCIN